MQDLGIQVFGPVPSRRLGRSIGINNIPPKSCSYFCIYCQLGKTLDMTITRNSFYKPETIFNQAKKKVIKAHIKDEHIDYLSFVPDGEPTLDITLGKEISHLKQIGFPIAVITNSALIWQKDITEEFALNLKQNL